MKAMIFAAGLGTRFKPWTDKHPKALARVNGKSLLQRNVEYLQQFGIKDVIVNVHHFADQVIALIESNMGWGSKIIFSDETKEILETGGGLKKASWYFDKDPFVILNVDVLTNLDLGKMIAHHLAIQPLATLAVMERETSRYFLFDEDNELCGWRDNQTGKERIVKTRVPLFPRAFGGIHIIDPAIFSLIRQEGKFSIVDLYLDLAATQSIQGFDQNNSKWVDVGKPGSVALAEELFP
jgi:N-acetyl-alpha-D-muramate 1-phosphate uridylyltransferase